MVCWFGTTTDIQERKTTENLLRRTEKLAAAGRLAATVAHEINNPLEAVSNLLYLSLHEDGLPIVSKRYLRMANEELRRVGHIVSQTLGFYREPGTPQPIDLRALVDEVLTLYQRRLEARQIRVTRSVEKSLVEGIAGELRQVMANLLSNALDAMEPYGVLSIEVRSHKDEVRLSISDTGHGISTPVLRAHLRTVLHHEERRWDRAGALGLEGNRGEASGAARGHEQPAGRRPRHRLRDDAAARGRVAAIRITSSLTASQGDCRRISIQRREEAIAPVKDVVAANPGAHAQHAAALLAGVHRERAVDRLGDAEFVVWIHQQCAALQLRSGAGELAQNEHAVVFRTRRAVLLGDQVHAVLERRDESQACRTIERQQLLARQRAMDIVDGNPARLAVLAVDVCDELLDLVHQPAITGDAFPAGHDDLIERNAATGGGVVAKQAGEGAQAFRNSFGVVQAVDADSDAHAVELPANFEGATAYLRAGRAFCELLEIDADGKGLNARLTPAVCDAAVVVLALNLGTGQKGADARHQVSFIARRFEGP